MREWLDRVWPSLVALLGTVGVVVALLVLFGDSTDDSTADDVAAGDQDGAGDAGAGEEEPTEDSTESPDEEPDDGSTSDSGDGDDDNADEEPDDEPTTAPPELRSPVGIANQTSVQDLELVAQQRLEEGGWEVAATSGFTGTVPETTVYYPPGMQEDAEALARQFPGIDRVETTFDGVNQERLVIVLVEDYLDVIE